MAKETYRSVNWSIWGNEIFHSLTPTEKNLYFYFLTSEKTKELGVFEVSPFEIAMYLSSANEIISIEKVKEMIRHFEELSLIKYDYVHNAVYVKYYAMHKIPHSGFMEFQILSSDIEACLKKGLKGLIDECFNDIKDTMITACKYAAFVLIGKYAPSEFTAVEFTKEDIMKAISEKRIQKYDMGVFDLPKKIEPTPTPDTLKNLYSDDFSLEY